jgi:hypothetical protein
MFGENLKLTTIRCSVCRRWTALRVDPEDANRHKKKRVLVQHAFVDRDGQPYLTPAERELFLSGVCNECWCVLCPSDPMAYN